VNVLIVEDDVDLLDLLAYGLRRDGYGVLTALDGDRGLQRWESEKPDLVLLDVNLPKINGFDVCRRIRASSSTPIILLTGRDDDDDVVRGLRFGADDYVTKPFSAKQLSARMNAVLRRSGDRTHQPLGRIRISDLMLELDSHQATKNGVDIQLTALEFRILYMLAMNAGRVVSYSRLVEYAWRYDGGDSSLLKTHISHIRDKLKLHNPQSGDIRAVAGVGYKLTAPLGASAEAPATSLEP
jgi:DNA-binding response OmpR family regulator